MDRARRRLGVQLATLALVGVATVAGCSSGPERSEASFCSTLRSEQERILDQFSEGQAAAEATGDGLVQAFATLGGSIQALGELRTYFHKLEATAPPAIQEEMEIIADQYDQQFAALGDAAQDPFGALAVAFFNSFAISGQLDAVNQYALEHCGQSV